MALSGPRRKMWGVEMAAVVLGLLSMAVQPSMQQDSLRNPLTSVAHKIKQGEARPFGIIATSSTAEKAFYDSGIFVRDTAFEFYGREFVFGSILGSGVIFVKSANRPSVHVGITVHILARHYDVRGIIHFGSAGGINNSLSIGTVVAAGRIAHTGVWTWQNDSAVERGLNFAKFNYPISENAQNLLGSARFDDSEVYEDGKLENKFWLSVDGYWLWLASKIQKVGEAEVVVGLKGASSDIYVNNYAYREFLWYNFKASIVDTTSAAVALAAKASNLPFIVFRGVANTAGASDEKNGALANENAVKAVEGFIFQATVPRSPSEK